MKWVCVCVCCGQNCNDASFVSFIRCINNYVNGIIFNESAFSMSKSIQITICHVFLAYVKYPKLVKISFEFHSKRQTRSFKIKHNADRKFFKKFLLELK